jgi:hypothetical protein
VPRAAWHQGGNYSIVNVSLSVPGSTLSYLYLILIWAVWVERFRTLLLLGLKWRLKVKKKDVKLKKTGRNLQMARYILTRVGYTGSFGIPPQGTGSTHKPWSVRN